MDYPNHNSEWYESYLGDPRKKDYIINTLQSGDVVTMKRTASDEDGELTGTVKFKDGRMQVGGVLVVRSGAVWTVTHVQKGLPQGIGAVVKVAHNGYTYVRTGNDSWEVVGELISFPNANFEGVVFTVLSEGVTL